MAVLYLNSLSKTPCDNNSVWFSIETSLCLGLLPIQYFVLSNRIIFSLYMNAFFDNQVLLRGITNITLYYNMSPGKNLIDTFLIIYIELVNRWENKMDQIQSILDRMLSCCKPIGLKKKK